MSVPHSIMLATEDELSEAICTRLVNEVEGRLSVSSTTFRQGGFGYLKSRLGPFCEIAARSPLLLLTDLDNAECPAKLIAGWTGGRTLPARLLFRVAVREVESWLLADHDGIRQLMGARIGKLPPDPDGVADPKGSLLNFAKRASRDVRADLLAEKGSTAKQGLGYNQRLVGFVRAVWNPEQAAARSRSLSKARVRLVQLADWLDAVSS